jgi:hypothetical protein
VRDTGLQAAVVLPTRGVRVGEQLVQRVADLALTGVEFLEAAGAQQDIQADAEQALVAGILY